MPNQFGGLDNFYVASKNGDPVAAKYLKDNSGSYVIDSNPNKYDPTPNPNGEPRPYIVPADYNPNATIQEYNQIFHYSLQSGPAGVAVQYTAFLITFMRYFPAVQMTCSAPITGIMR
jgi:hypothetical protein